MAETDQKRVDESWKEKAEREKHLTDTAPSPSAPGSVSGTSSARDEAPELPEAQFDLFISGLAVEALVAMGDMPHPATRKQVVQLPQAKYLIDLLGVLEEKTRGNLTVDEARVLKDSLYQLRMRYLTKSKC